jgi:hypothetical protein
VFLAFVKSMSLNHVVLGTPQPLNAEFKTIKMDSGAGAGLVLTSDSKGNASWQSSGVVVNDSVSFADTMAGLWTSPLPIQVTLQNSGGNTVCTMVVTGTTTGVSNNTNYITFNTPIPTAMRPATNVYGFCPIINNGLFTTGNVEVLEDGAVYITTSAGDNFGGTGFCGFGVFTFSWLIGV